MKLRLYNRLMIYNTFIFIVITYVFAFFGTKFYNEYEVLKKLEQSKNTLITLSNYYERKQLEFPDTILPFYQTKDFNLNNTFINLSKEKFSQPTIKKEIFSVLQNIAEKDPDISEIILYKEINGSEFIYQKNNQTVELYDDNGHSVFDLSKSTEFGRISIGSRISDKTPNGFKSYVYGIGGVIGYNENEILGKFMLVFKTDPLKRIYENSNDTYGRFMLLTREGDIIFDSFEDYDDGLLQYFDEIKLGKKIININGILNYVQTITQQKSGLIGINIVPIKDIKNSNITILVYLVLALVAIICLIFYKISALFILKRIECIETAIKNINVNNLSYRIPLTKSKDEFENITISFNNMCSILQETIEKEYVNEIKKKNAELTSLQSGINPHFLYNTLEVIRVLAVKAENEDVSKMIVNLANLYRSIVKNSMFIPIRNEVNICELYIDIFSARYNNSLEYELDIDSKIMTFGIPKNLLQPIIENYFVHGIKNVEFINKFIVHGNLIGDDICFIFENNGHRMSKEQLEKTRKDIESVDPNENTSYGLLNVQRRIRLIYGEHYGVSIDSNESEMTKITILIKAMTVENLTESLNGGSHEN